MSETSPGTGGELRTRVRGPVLLAAALSVIAFAPTRQCERRWYGEQRYAAWRGRAIHVAQDRCFRVPRTGALRLGRRSWNRSVSAPPPAPAYHTSFDRGPSSGPNAWNLTAANGSIAGTDLFAILEQFGHSCA